MCIRDSLNEQVQGNDRQKTLIRRAQNASSRIKGMAEVFLNIGRARTGQNNAFCSMPELIAGLKESWKQKAENKGLKPVSYTHLDVYKRQVKDGTRAKSNGTVYASGGFAGSIKAGDGLVARYVDDLTFAIGFQAAHVVVNLWRKS